MIQRRTYILAFLSLLFFMVFPLHVEALTPELLLIPSKGILNEGELFTLSVEAVADKLLAVSFTLEFDSGIIEYQPQIFPNNIRVYPTGDLISVTVAFDHEESSEAYGMIHLVTLNFRAIRSGKTDLRFKDGSIQLTDSRGLPVPNFLGLRARWSEVIVGGGMTLERYYGKPDERITCRATGFASGEIISLHIGNISPPTFPATIIASDTGEVEFEFIVPDFTYGLRDVELTGSSGRRYTTSFLIEPRLRSVDPINVKSEGRITLQGCGFPPRFQLKIYPEGRSLGLFSSDEYGKVSADLTLPKLPGGLKDLWIYQDDNLIYIADNALTVIPQIEITPLFGEIGQEFSITGTAFAPGEIVEIRIGSREIKPIVADEMGEFRSSFVLEKGWIIQNKPTDLIVSAIGERSGLSDVESIRYVPTPKVSGFPSDGQIHPGEEMELRCEGFPSNGLIDVELNALSPSISCFDFNGVPLNREYLGNGSFGRYIVPPDGSFILRFNVPNMPRGPKTLKVEATSFQLRSEVTKELTLVPSISAEVEGILISIEGNGFAPNSDVDVYIEEEQPRFNRKVRTDGYGSFRTSIVMNDGASGTFTVIASEVEDEGKADCKIIVSKLDDTRFLSISPSSAENGSVLKIQGAGFVPLKAIGIYIEDDAGLNRLLATGSTDEMGFFSLSSTIQDIPRAGEKRITIYQSGRKVKEAKFTLLESLRVDKESGAPGEIVSVMGSGYQPYVDIRISLGKTGYEKLLLEGNANEFGGFSLPIAIPPQEFGDKVLKVEIGDETKYLPFRILPKITGAEIERRGFRVLGYSAQAGDVLYIYGSGFVPGEEIEIRFGGLLVDDAIEPVKALHDGSLEANFVLTDELLRKRENFITVTGSESKYPVSYPEPIIALERLELIPDRGEPGSSFTVKGTTYPFNLKFGSYNLSFVGYDANGDPIMRIPPQVSGGEYVVTDGVNEARFTVIPSLYFIAPDETHLRQIEGVPGQRVELHGEGFMPGRLVKISLGLDGVIETVKADAEGGKFTKSLILDEQPGGEALIVADDGTLSSSVTVVYSPIIKEVSQRKLKLIVEGIGFGPQEDISVELNGTSLRIDSDGTTDERGSFKAECVLPSGISGTTVKVKGSGSGFTEEIAKTITTSNPSLMVSPGEGTLGTQVDLSGDWFYPGEEITIDFDGERLSAKADENGMFKLSALISEDYPDNHYIRFIARGGKSGAIASAIFRYRSRIKYVEVSVIHQSPEEEDAAVAGDTILIKAHLNRDIFKAISGSFQIGQDIQGELRESNGIWSAQYTVKAGDYVDGEYVTVTLTDESGQTATKSSDRKIWIDAVVQIGDITVSPDKAKAGVKLSVMVEAEPSCTGTFSIKDVVQDVPLKENPDHPGSYSGSYTVKPGDKAVGDLLSVSLTDKYGNSETRTGIVNIDAIAEIYQVSVDKDVIKRGETLKITVKGEPDSSVKLSIGPGIIEETEMVEKEKTPEACLYTYTFSPRDGIEEYNAILTVSLTDPLDNVASYSKRISIDTLPPEIYGVQVNRYRVENGDEIEIKAKCELECDVKADLSPLDTTRSEPVEFSEVEPGNFLLRFKISSENLAADGKKEIELTATDRAGNIGTYKLELLLKNQYTFKLKLKRGLNLISIPVNDPELRSLDDLTDRIGPSCVAIVCYDSQQEKFVTYTRSMGPDSLNNLPVEGGRGYIVVMNQPAEVTLKGRKWVGSVLINSKVFLFGLPVDDRRVRRASDLVWISNGAIEQVIKIEPTPKITFYYPSLPPDSPSNFLLSPGEGYILMVDSSKLPLSLEFHGESWGD